jgi:hypothetical protein
MLRDIGGSDMRFGIMMGETNAYLCWVRRVLQSAYCLQPYFCKLKHIHVR